MSTTTIDDARRRHDNEGGRVLPHDLQAEESLLGAMLLSKDAVASAVGIVAPDDFYNPAHGHIFEAMVALYAKGRPVDHVTVADELRRRARLQEVGGAGVFLSLEARTPSIGSAGRYAEIIRRDSLDRSLARRAEDVREAVLNRLDPGPALRMLEAAATERLRTNGSVVDDLFRLYRPGELLDADRRFSWLLRGLLVSPTYGTLAGEKKTLKSYLAMFINLAIASGTSLFGQFEVDEGMPVVTYVGEGGRIPYTRRLERVAHAMGVDLRHTPLYSSFDVAAVQSPRFAETLTRDLRDHGPGLVTLDPLYAFHGAASNASNLHEEGALLSSMSTPCIDAGASLLVLNHFNKTGGGRGLDRITQAGGQEWADTWLLLSHREAPDVAKGRFRLLLEAGSRQWGGSEWDLDLHVGRFDVERGEFDGDISWELRRHSDGAADSQEAKALALVADQPFQLTREELAKGIGGNLQRARAFVVELESKGAIASRLVTRVRSDGRKHQVWAFHLNGPASEAGTTLDAEGEACA